MYSPFRAKTSLNLGKILTKIPNRFLKVGDGIGVSFLNFFFARWCLHIFGGKFFKGSHFEFFAEKVVGGNAVQIFSNFPAKSLSI